METLLHSKEKFAEKIFAFTTAEVERKRQETKTVAISCHREL